MTVGVAKDNFPTLRDEYGCLAVSRSDGRRCQLQNPHDGAHAHAWSDLPTNLRRGWAGPLA